MLVVICQNEKCRRCCKAAAIIAAAQGSGDIVAILLYLLAFLALIALLSQREYAALPIAMAILSDAVAELHVSCVAILG